MALKRHVQTSSEEKDPRRTPRNFEGLLLQLDDNLIEVRRWAARDLVNYPESVKPLCQALQKEKSSLVREAIFTTLIKMGGEEVVKNIIPILRSDDAELRNHAIDVLRNLPNETSLYIDDLLEDHDPDVRIFAINILEYLKHPQVESWLIRTITKDTHINVCAAVVDLLGEVGTANAIPALEALKERFHDDFIHFACDLALKRIL